jgi:hypothetical protein
MRAVTNTVRTVFETYDRAVAKGHSSDEVLESMAKMMCDKSDDGYGGKRRETAKQLVISLLLMRECGVVECN